MQLTLNLSPVRSDDFRRTINWNHPILLVEDIIVAEGRIESNQYDLSELPDGATAQHPVLGKVSRTGDNYECTLRLSHGADAPYETRFPDPLVLTANGEVPLPLYNNPEPEVEDELAE